MGVIIQNGVCYSGTQSVSLTQEQYDALTPAEKNNGIIYIISDADISASDIKYTDTSTLADALSTAEQFASDIDMGDSFQLNDSILAYNLFIISCITSNGSGSVTIDKSVMESGFYAGGVGIYINDTDSVVISISTDGLVSVDNSGSSVDFNICGILATSFSPSVSTERLIFNQYQFDEQVRIPPLDYKTEGRLFSEYLTYNSSTNQYEVIKPFIGLVVAWVYQTRSGSTYPPKGEFRVNGTSVVRYEAKGTNQGSTGGEKFIYDFQIGDKFSSYNYIDNGYPKHAFKVFLTDMGVKNMQFVDEDTE